MLRLMVNYIRVVDCKHDAEKTNENYRKGYKSRKRKLINTLK